MTPRATEKAARSQTYRKKNRTQRNKNQVTMHMENDYPNKTLTKYLLKRGLSLWFALGTKTNLFPNHLKQYTANKGAHLG